MKTSLRVQLSPLPWKSSLQLQLKPLVVLIQSAYKLHLPQSSSSEHKHHQLVKLTTYTVAQPASHSLLISRQNELQVFSSRSDGRPFGHNKHGPKSGGCCAPFVEGSWALSDTMRPGPRPTFVSSFILIHSTVWPQYTKVTKRETDRQTDRQTGQDRQWFDSTGPTVLQTVAQKRVLCCLST